MRLALLQLQSETGWAAVGVLVNYGWPQKYCQGGESRGSPSPSALLRRHTLAIYPEGNSDHGLDGPQERGSSERGDRVEGGVEPMSARTISIIHSLTRRHPSHPPSSASQL